MNKVLELLSEEIADGLVREFSGRTEPVLPENGTIKPLVPVPSGEALEQDDPADTTPGPSYRSLEERLQRAESALARLLSRIVGAVDEGNDGVRRGEGSYPNLKYSGHKYSDVDSVLKYVERDEEKGGFKLVIMNFND